MPLTSTMQQTRSDLHWFLEQARPKRLRSMRAFAEQEIIIPAGPFVGRRFRCARQPYTQLWFDEVDSGRWSRCVATGPTQSGKTLSCFVIPLVYHLFELGETAICGLPDMDMAADKWREDILPVIEQSRYRDLLPRQGAGSRGGRVETFQFGNGATLKFMSGGGSDKSRAGFTSRVVVITETDGMDQPGTTSRESDKITQLEARTRAYGSRKRIYMECTVSTEQGRTWQEYSTGTASRILLPCPGCSQWVSPERADLKEWESAETVLDAEKQAYFACPACGMAWTEADRTQANLAGRLLHRGQAMDDQGHTTGDPPRTDTLGFRWSGANNLLLTAGDLAIDEWKAQRAHDEDNAERKMCQFVWCIPYKPPDIDESVLTLEGLAGRMAKDGRGVVPPETTWLTVGVDVQKRFCKYTVFASTPGVRGRIVDYGTFDVAADDLGVERALLQALRDFRETCDTGWDGRRPDQVWIDSGWMPEVVYQFCRESKKENRWPFRPTKGYGFGQDRSKWYGRPKATTSMVRFIGDGFHVTKLRPQQVDLVELDADYHKTLLHERLKCKVDAPDAIQLFHGPKYTHTSFCKHLTSEHPEPVTRPTGEVVMRWVRESRSNHWLDSTCLALAAGRYLETMKERRDAQQVSGNWFAQQVRR